MDWNDLVSSPVRVELCARLFCVFVFLAVCLIGSQKEAEQMVAGGSQKKEERVALR